ncbi:hypothetical protein DENSPDRAFT_824012 [Dentipellis sp. KUC8613]|nr:hypothetical protein DENSPDRAFT_824012 [Dentipellis sp. KUC8613]
MSARADSATPVVLSSLCDDLIGRKLRLVGRVLCYEPTTGIAVLGDESHAIPVDVALCLHARGGLPWLVDARSVVTVFGYLERLDIPFTMPDALPHHPPPKLIPNMLVQAILVLNSPDLDMRQWNETVAQMTAMGMTSSRTTGP